MERICSTCKVKKSIESYHFYDKKNNIRNYRCKKCTSEHRKLPRPQYIEIPNMPNEIWKDVFGYENIYMVSNMGRLKSLERKYLTKAKTETTVYPMILKQIKVKCGYLIVCLHKNKKQKNHYVHILVASAFLNKIKYKTDVNHKDCIKTHNHVVNLEWVNKSENSTHYYNIQAKTSRFTGVSCYNKTDKWVAAIYNPELKRTIHLGIFITEEEAASAYYKEFIRLGKVNKYLMV